MAKGRIIVNAITMDKRVNDLSDDTSRLAFTWLVTFADREGRTHGDPAIVRSLLFPRRSDVTPERMETYIREWAAAGLIVWYEANGDRWIQFPAFAKHQTGFDQRHEPESTFPAPPGVRPMPVTAPGASTNVVRTDPVQCTSEHEHEHEEKENGEFEIENEGEPEIFSPPPVPERKRDYLDDVLAYAQGPQRAGVADPAEDPDRWLTFRSKAIGVYQQQTGIRAVAPANQKAISDLAAEAGFDPGKWERSVASCILAGVKGSNLSCMIDTYRDGGDYKAMLDKHRNGRGRHPPDRLPKRDLEFFPYSPEELAAMEGGKP